ncbi:MAG: cold shock domain-containing protein [Candidatus Solibacter sp.]
MHQGTIARFGSQSYGFIKVDGADELWFHARDSKGTPQSEFQPERRVNFLIAETATGPRAIDVRVEIPGVAEQQSAAPKQIGWILKLDSREFGFIECESGRRYFFHASAMLGGDFADLTVDTAVEFCVRRGGDGRKKAYNVRPF